MASTPLWKRILVGIDASEGAYPVLRYAADVARLVGGKLILLRAYTVPFGVPPEAFAYVPEQLGPLLERDARQSLEQISRGLPAELVERLEVRLGAAWEQICEVAKHDRVDLVVIGSHGYRGLDRLLGTTAARVVNHAHCATLVVRPPGE